MNKTRTLTLLLAAFLISTLGGCNKDDKNSGDLTSSVVGHYSSGSGSGLVDIYVTRINDNTISVALEAYDNITFGTSTMTTSSAFTLSTATKPYYDLGGTQTDTYTGTGSQSGNVISLIVHQRRTNAQGDVTYEGDDTYNGTRQ